MDTGKQINAMVVVLLLTVIAVGVYALFDPFRADKAEDDQLAMSAERGANTFALNCRLCHGDRGQGGANGGRLPAAPALDRADLQGIEMGGFSFAVFDENFAMIMNTITCGRAGTAMPTWGRVHGGTLSGEQIRQLAVVITGGNLGADPVHRDAGGAHVGFWEDAQHAADEIDAETTSHSTLQMPGGALDSTATAITVSNAAPMSENQYIRIDEERMQIVEVPSTGQRLVKEVGRVPDELFVSGADGIAIGEIIRVDAELLEVTGLRADGDLSIALDVSVGSSDTVISVDNPAFFAAGYVVHAGNEQIEIEGAVETGRVLAIATGRAQSTISVSGTVGIEVGARIRMGEELLEVLSIEPATVTLERGANDLDGNDTTAAGHTSGARILKLVEELEEDADVEPDDPDTGQTLLETLSVTATTVVVSGITGISSGDTYQIGSELVRVTETQPAVLRVERGVGGTDRAEHSRRAPIFDDNFLSVQRGVLGTSASAHDAGTDLLFDVIEVEREVQGTKVTNHTRNAELFLGHVVIVERGALDTDAVEHVNGTLVMDFPAPPNPDEVAITGATCGQNPPPTPGETEDPGATPREGAEQAAVSLDEFEMTVDRASALGEAVDFTVTNDGTIFHNFRVVATDLAPDALPLDGPVVDESQFDEVGGFSSLLQPGEQLIVNQDLAPGSYVLFCNVAGHYGSGMFTGFEVTGP